MKPLRSKLYRSSQLLNPAFVWTPGVATDIRLLFERVRRQQQQPVTVVISLERNHDDR